MLFRSKEQKKWLKGEAKQGKNIILEDGSEKNFDECSDDELLKANTKEKLFLQAVVSLVDAMEDVYLRITI